jgi:hypothetical protein
LTNATIGDGVTSIGDYAFYQCSSLTNVTIPCSVTDIGEWAFGSCSSLATVRIPNSVTNIGDSAYQNCYSLRAVYFQGNAPTLGSLAFCYEWYGVLYYDWYATIYYSPGTTGWASTFGGVPAVLWNPQVQTRGASLRVLTNGFGFTITGTPNIPVVVEACANLANPVWNPLQSLILINGSIYFSDPQWTNYPGRFYRLGSP